MTNEYDEILGREIVTTRVFDAPRDVVFEAWTDPEQLKLWWGPRGFSNTFHVFEMNPGGVWRYTMHGPDGRDFENESRFVEIVAPQRIILDHISAPHFRLTVLFEELGDRTKITFRQLFETPSVYTGVKQFAVRGNEDNMDRLAGFLAEKQTRLQPGIKQTEGMQPNESQWASGDAYGRNRANRDGSHSSRRGGRPRNSGESVE